MSDGNTPFTGSSFWQRPEGKTGIAIGVLALGGLLFFGSEIGDFVVHALDNTLHFILTATALAMILALIADPKLRALVFYIYRSLMRFLTGLFINIDPVGIIKTYRDRMQGKLKEMYDSLSSLKGRRAEVIRAGAANDSELDKELRLVKEAQIKNDVRVLSLEGRQVTRLQTRKERLMSELNRLSVLIAVMDKYQVLCQDTVTDMSREIEWREYEQRDAKASRQMVRSAKAILKGLPEKEWYDESIAKLEQDYTLAIGEVENFLDVTKDILSKSDLQDSADSKKAIEMLTAWQNKNTGVLLGGNGGQVTKADIISEATKAVAAQ